MVEVDVSELEAEDRDGLASFVESRLAVTSERSGGTITFDDKSERTHVSRPEIRTILKRYLHKKNLKKGFRLLAEDGSFKLVKKSAQEEGEEEEDEEKKKEGK